MDRIKQQRIEFDPTSMVSPLVLGFRFVGALAEYDELVKSIEGGWRAELQQAQYDGHIEGIAPRIAACTGPAFFRNSTHELLVLPPPYIPSGPTHPSSRGKRSWRLPTRDRLVYGRVDLITMRLTSGRSLGCSLDGWIGSTLPDSGAVWETRIAFGAGAEALLDALAE